MPDDSISKDQLLEALRTSGEEVVGKLSKLPSAAFESGCYENGWNGRQVLAHVAGIEWSYPRLLEVARNADAPAEKTEKPREHASKPASGGINSYNDRLVERYADTPVSELIEVFKTNRAATIAAIEDADPDLFYVKVRSAGGIPGPLGTVLNYVAVMHVRGHVEDIVKAAQA